MKPSIPKRLEKIVQRDLDHSFTRRLIRGVYAGFAKDFKVGLRLIMSILLAIGACFIALCGLVYWNQEFLIFHPSRVSHAPPDIAGYRSEEHEIKDVLGQGMSFYAWHIAKPGCRRCVVFFGGNAHSMSEAEYRVKWLAKGLGCSVFISDYPGYGKNSGRPGERDIRLLALAWGRYLNRKLGYQNSDLLVWGQSLGGGVAVQFAEACGSGGLVLEETFTSLREMGASVYPFLPVSFLCKHPFEVRERLPLLNGPVCIAHSPDDEIIPFSNARLLFDAANKDLRQLIELKGGHNESYILGSEDYMRKVRQQFPQWAINMDKENNP